MLKNKSILKMQKIKNTKVSLYRCKYDYLSDIEFKDYFKTVINKLNSLDSREREITELHYGIGNSRSYSFREIGKIFEISCERVRQIENNAITKLRKSMQDRT
jgi:RNA polymerase sigma factor (sigma-70 family)